MGGAIAVIKDGDMLTIDAVVGALSIDLSETEIAARLTQNTIASCDTEQSALGQGRDLFGLFRKNCLDAQCGATSFS